MSTPFLVTGFGPFLDHTINPSAVIAEQLSVPSHILPVSFAAVEAFLEQLEQDPPARLLMLGVHGRAVKFHLERQARNRVGSAADVDGVAKSAGPIDPSGPPQLRGTLWPKGFRTMLGEPKLTNSLDAGTYLCNYAYYRAIQRLPSTRVGFLHIPRFEAISHDDQLPIVQKIVGMVHGAAV